MVRSDSDIVVLGILMAIVGATTPRCHASDWPTYRGDGQRSGYTAETLSPQLSLHWVYHPRHAPQPAWSGRDTRMPFDQAFPCVTNGDTLYFSSSADCKVYALDVVTAAERWTFFTDAPVRFPPTVWNDRLFVVSDDGYLYCLAAADGGLLWKVRGGPESSMILANDRIASRWPARGAPVVADGVVYFAAGIWPSEGIFIYAIDAETGNVLWCNDHTGGLYIGQPHGGAYAYSGVSAQGNLVVAGETLLVPTGRAVPAAFRRSDGEFLYFHLQQNTKYGGSEILVADNVFFSRGAAFDLSTGARNSHVPALEPSLTAVAPGCIVSWKRGELQQLRWAETETKDRKGNATRHRGLTEISRTAVPYGGNSLIVAGQNAVSCGVGLEGHGVCTIDLETKDVLWSVPIDGVPRGLAAANGRLYVSTEDGSIHCFGATGGAGPRTITAEADSNSITVSHEFAEAAESILERSGVTEGYCIDLACGDGSLALALARRSNLTIYAIDSDPKNVAAARQRLGAAGLYGARVTVHQADPAASAYPDYFANLVVSGRSVTEGPDAGLDSEINRILRPFGGVACLGPSSALKRVVRGPLEGVGSWTHQYCDPANTNCSTDSIVRGPLGVLWFNDLGFQMPSRHGRGRAPLFSEGRLYVEGLDGVLCVDAYNGRKLWEFEIPGIQSVYDGEHLMGASGTGSNICLGKHGLYIHSGKTCARLDPATGDLLAEFVPPNEPNGKPGTWGIVACVDDTLFGTLAVTEHLVTYRFREGDMRNQFTESILLFAADAKTGEVRWRFQPKHTIRHNTIAIGRDRVHLIDRPIALSDRERESKRGVPAPKDQQSMGTLVTLDAANGDVLWTADDVYGTVLVLSEEHDTLLMCYQDWRFKLASELGGKMATFEASTGKRRWEITSADYVTRPVINGRTVYLQPNAWDIVTGEQLDFTLKGRSYGCGIPAGSKHMMVYRSATLGYVDLQHDYGTESYGGIRPGCWINAIPAGGLVLLPDATDRCTCSYLIKASIALTPYGARSPRITPAGGTFAEPMRVELKADAQNATVRYTLDGTNPTSESPTFTGDLTIEENCTLQTRAFVEGMPPSPTNQARFTIDPNTIPIEAAGWAVYDAQRGQPPKSDWQLREDYVTEISNLYVGNASETSPLVERPGSLRVWNGGDPVSDGELSIQIASSDNDTLGVVFRLQGDDRYYVWAMDQQRGHHILGRKDGNDYRVLSHKAGGYEPNRWYDVRIVMDGPRITVLLDGEKDLEATDDSFASGRFALYSWGCAGTKFRGVRWTTLPTAEE